MSWLTGFFTAIKNVATGGTNVPAPGTPAGLNFATGVSSATYNAGTGNVDLVLSAQGAVFSVATYHTTGEYSAAIAAATSAAIAAGGGTVYYPPGIMPVASSVTLSASVSHQFQAGAILQPASGQTVTVSGPVVAASTQQIFDQSAGGFVAMSTGSNPYVYADWWGPPSSASNVLQLACNSAHPAGVEVRMNNTTYNAGSGSVGLVIANNNARLVGVSESQTGGGADQNGPVLTYGGTGTAVQLGNPSSAVTGITLQNVLITPASNTAIGLDVANVQGSGLVSRVGIYGQTGSTNICLQVRECNNVVFDRLDVHGGAGGGAYSTAAIGLNVASISGAPNTVTPFRSCYFHYCSTAAQIAGYARFDDCIFESSYQAINVGASSTVYLNDCWWENTGSSNPIAASVCYVTSTSTVQVKNPTVVMYSGQLVAFTVQAAAALHVTGGQMAAGGPISITAIADSANPTVTIANPLYLGGTEQFYVTIAGVTGAGCTPANGTWPITRVSDTQFVINGPTTTAAFSGSGATAAPVPVLFHADSETSASRMTFENVELQAGVNGLGTGAPWTVQPGNGAGIYGELISWRVANWPALNKRWYSFVQKSVSGTQTYNPVPCSDGYAGNNIIMPAAGYVLGLYAYGSGAAAGTVRCIIYKNSSTDMLDSYGGTALPTQADTGFLVAPFAQGDALTVYLATTGVTSGQDVNIDVLVALGDATQ